MGSYAGITLMGSQPIAGRVRAMHGCETGGSLAIHSHRIWQLDLATAGAADQAIKPATRMFVAVPDTNRTTRRPRGTP